MKKYIITIILTLYTLSFATSMQVIGQPPLGGTPMLDMTAYQQKKVELTMMFDNIAKYEAMVKSGNGTFRLIKEAKKNIHDELTWWESNFEKFKNLGEDFKNTILITNKNIEGALDLSENAYFSGHSFSFNNDKEKAFKELKIKLLLSTSNGNIENMTNSEIADFNAKSNKQKQEFTRLNLAKTRNQSYMHKNLGGYISGLRLKKYVELANASKNKKIETENEKLFKLINKMSNQESPESQARLTNVLLKKLVTQNMRMLQNQESYQLASLLNSNPPISKDDFHRVLAKFLENDKKIDRKYGISKTNIQDTSNSILEIFE